MKIELTKEQYKDLLISIVIGTYIRESVDEQNGKDWQRVSAAQDYFISHAKDFGCEELTQNFEGHVLISDTVIEEYHDHYIEEFEEESFWHDLTTRLGQRDFEKNATASEREHVKQNDGWLGGVIDRYYQKYEDEFEARGIERLKIDESQK